MNHHADAHTRARELEGKVALITGVTRRAGIGAAIARELANAGAKLVVAFFRKYDQERPWGLELSETDALLDELGSTSDVCGVEIDLADPSGPRELIERSLTQFGRIDILVNNAAHWEPGGVDHVDAAQLDRHYAVNTRATVLLSAEFARCESAGPRRIVNVTSGQGAGPMPDELAYVVTKAALDALTITLSAELAPRRITVNAIDPGPTDTGWLSIEQREALLRRGELALPVDTARLVRLLARDDASSINGQIVRVRPGSRQGS
jgi:3-oxoacyl-[acyl-carrier protein] reductase